MRFKNPLKSAGRRRLGPILLMSLAVGFAARTAQATTPVLASVPVASGFTKPVFLTHAPGDFTRLFVVEQTGKIKIIKNGAVLPTAFLDVSSIINSVGLEYGLLGLAFHPNFQQNGFFYVCYTATTGVSDPVVARFHVTANPDIADFSSKAVILHIPYTIAAHRAGWIDFGADGHLYLSTGDSGEMDPGNNASNLGVLKGKILRLDVNGPDGLPGTGDDDGFPADADRNYQIPAGNPFIGVAGAMPEIWAYGLRNPWRCSFDRAAHDLYIGDVGQGQREEIDFQPFGTGGSFFGWRCLEGTIPTNYAGCPAVLPPSVPPIHEYSHSVGSAVIGGYVYRGCAIPDLQGKYIFGDWGGKVFSLRYTPGVGVSELVEHTAQVALPGGGIFSAFGEDALGELYVTLWSSGQVRKIVRASFIGPDCNGNGINDGCDIASGASPDLNGNGVPDECDPPPPACPADIAPIDAPNGLVDVDDLFLVINNWGSEDPQADIVPPAVIDIDDLFAVINAWGPCR